jgi:hypothetical protein
MSGVRRTGGSRRAPSRSASRRHLAGPLAAVAVLLAALVAVLLTGGPRDVRTTTPAGSTGAVVDRTLLGCPDVPSSSGTRAVLRAGLAPAPAGLDLPADGSVQQGEPGSSGTAVEVTRGALAVLPGTGGRTVDATGGAAAGLFAARTDVTVGRSLAVTSCAAPRSQWWFTGAGAGLDHASTLVLANLDPGPASVDLQVLGPDGEVATAGTTGIPLAARSVRRVPLADIAPQTDELALRVSTSRGRVVADVTDAYRPGRTGPQGAEWLAGTDLPTRTVRLAGVPARRDSSTLLVANPSDLEAVVDVRVSGRAGSFAPAGLEPVSVAPGSVTAVDLGDLLPPGEAVGLRLTSRVPVVAALRSTVGGDHSYATVVRPLAGPAAAPVPGGTRATVQLTAGAVAARVAVEAYDDRGGRVDRATVAIPAGATGTWTPRDGARYLVVTPPAGPGRVSGAVTYTGSGAAAMPLTALPFRVQRPAVRPGVG